MSDSKKEIMEATYSALCRHGYADLTIEKISAESEKGKSLIYYHFDDKEDLILEFMDFMTENMDKCLNNLKSKDGEERLEELLDLLLGFEDEDMWEFYRAMKEIQGRAQYNSELQEKFMNFDDLLMEEFTQVIDQIDVENVEIKAEILLSAVQGTLNRKITSDGRESMEEIKEELKDIAES